MQVPVSREPSGATVSDRSQAWITNTDQAPTAQQAPCRSLGPWYKPHMPSCSRQAHHCSQVRTQASSCLLGWRLCLPHLPPAFPIPPNNHTCSSADVTETRAFPDLQLCLGTSPLTCPPSPSILWPHLLGLMVFCLPLLLDCGLPETSAMHLPGSLLHPSPTVSGTQ